MLIKNMNVVNLIATIRSISTNLERVFKIMRIISKPLSKHTGVEILDIDLKSINNETVIKELNNFFQNIQLW